MSEPFGWRGQSNGWVILFGPAGERAWGGSNVIDWEIHGIMFSNCNCAYGCPCQFNALPTNGHCRAICFLQVDKGHFGDARLDGLSMGFAVAWPGAVHQGRGTMQPIIDEKATEPQTAGLLSILTAKDTDPMTTVFAIYTAMCDQIHDPIHTKISIDLDMNSRRAKFEAAGIATGRGEPILNPVTKKEHRAGILLPNGLEYGQSEVGRGWSESAGDLVVKLEDTHAHWCEIHMNQHRAHALRQGMRRHDLSRVQPAIASFQEWKAAAGCSQRLRRLAAPACCIA
jgi:hypothetical protein